MFKKIIATILIIGIIASLNFNLFIFKPKRADALIDVIGGPSNVLHLIKEWGLDIIGSSISNMILRPLQQKIIDWGQGKTSDSGVSLRVLDYVNYFKNAIAVGSAKYIVEFRKTEIEPAIKNVLEDLGFATNYTDLPTYSQYARSTLEDDLGDNYQQFVDSGYSLEVGGWAGWFSMIKPQNNVFGQILMAGQERRRMELAEKEAADKETDVSGGYRNEEATTLTDVDACKQQCMDELATEGEANLGEIEQCKLNCEQEMTGYAIKTKIKNVGSDIRTHMESALSADMQRIIDVKEITQLIGVFFSALINRGISLGLETLNSVVSNNQLENSRSESQDFLYYQEFKESQTLQDKKDTRSQVLNNILKGIQSLSRSMTSCVKDDMVKYPAYAKNVSSIISPNTEALYVGLEGVNLKPDFTVLDPRFAPYTVYGYSYSKIPSSKFPSKCEQTLNALGLSSNSTCIDIASGLEPANPSCTMCMYDHDRLTCPPEPYPPQTYTGTEPDWNVEQKNEFYWNCRTPYNKTLNRCSECLEAADEKCNQEDEDLRNACIERVCCKQNENGICTLFDGLDTAESIANGLDFHQKCLIEEKKEACFTCLREYFVPATYCQQIIDYTARSIIKYPVVVKKVGKNKFPWIGPYDQEIANEYGKECDNNDYAEGISLALICRIFPDFRFDGENWCTIYCSNTPEEQLHDITDFRPSEKDCNFKKVPEYNEFANKGLGGTEPWQAINDGLLLAKEKCCAAAWQADYTNYSRCIGSGATSEEEEEEEEEECCYYETVGYEVVEPTLNLSPGQEKICFKIGNTSGFNNNDNKSIVLALAGDDNAHFVQVRHRITDGDHTLQPKTGFCFGCDSINENCGWCVAETTDRLPANNNQIYKVSWDEGGYSVVLTNLNTGEASGLSLEEYSDIYTNGLELDKYCRGGSGCSWPKHTYPDANSAANIQIVSCSNGSFCGDGVCDLGESELSCPEDCTSEEDICGDDVCGASENIHNCPQDCEFSF